MSQIITLLEDGWAGKLPSLGYLQTVAGLNDTGAAMLCGVASETYRRWRTDRTPPLSAFRLLSIMAGYVPWRGWEQWFFNPFDQTLNQPDLKDGFSPVQIAEFLFLRHRYQQKKLQIHIIIINLTKKTPLKPAFVRLIPYIDKPKGARSYLALAPPCQCRSRGIQATPN